MAMTPVDHKSVLKSRAEMLKKRLLSAAEELILRGAYGVAAQITLPGLDEPLTIAAGIADTVNRAPLRGDELFAAASQAKMFTAASVLLLEKAGALSFNDPVSRYIPDVPAVDSGATIKQFLNHTSGIGNFLHAMPVLPHPWPHFSYEDLMALARLQGRRFPAGMRLDYNNTDVVALARVCEIVSGEPRAEFLKKRIFGPLGMADTYVGSTGDWPRDRMAHGYYRPTLGYDGPAIDVATLPDYTVASAAGDIVSSLPDMLRWASSLLAGDSPIGLSLKDFVKDIADLGSAIDHWFLPHTYARGVESWRMGGRAVWGHRGSFFGYHSGTFVEPVSGIGISMFLTMCTETGFMHFIDRQGYEYMAFLNDCVGLAIDVVEMP